MIYRFRGRAEAYAGDLFWAKAGKRDGRMAMQRFDLGAAGEGFLPVKDRQYPEGAMTLVAIRREAIGTKRPVLTDKPVLLLPAATIRPGTDNFRPGPLGEVEPDGSLTGPLTKTPDRPGPATDVSEPLALLAAIARSDVETIRTSSGQLAADLKPYVPEDITVETDEGLGGIFAEALDDTLAREVPLPEGGALIIDETEALTAIDVDLGSGRGQSKHGAGESLKRRVLDHLGTVLAMRAIGGQVVLDLPRAAVRAPKVVRDQMTAALKPAGLMSIPAVTKEGLVVMILGRNRRSVFEHLTVPTAEGIRPGRDLAPDVEAWVAYGMARDALAGAPAARFTLGLPKKAAQAFEQAGALRSLEERFGARLTLDTTPGLREVAP